MSNAQKIRQIVATLDRESEELATKRSEWTEKARQMLDHRPEVTPYAVAILALAEANAAHERWSALQLTARKLEAMASGGLEFNGEAGLVIAKGIA
jgi:hypothetical protein